MLPGLGPLVAFDQLTGTDALLPEDLRHEAFVLWQLMRDVGANGETKILERWSLLLSKVQAVALDRAGVPHPALMIPITQEQQNFWRDFGRRVEFLPEEELEDAHLLEALSEEWTVAATIAEAIHLYFRSNCIADRDATRVCILGPSACLEYCHGIGHLEEQLALLLEQCIRISFCGPEVPDTRGVNDGLRYEHIRGYWHEVKDHMDEAELFIALNAGLSVREYKKHWKETLLQLPAYASVYITGYTMSELQDAESEFQRTRPGTHLHLRGVCRSSTLKGYDRVELGTTPCSFPGKANYSECLAVLGPMVNF